MTMCNIFASLASVLQPCLHVPGASIGKLDPESVETDVEPPGFGTMGSSQANDTELKNPRWPPHCVLTNIA